MRSALAVLHLVLLAAFLSGCTGQTLAPDTPFATGTPTACHSTPLPTLTSFPDGPDRSKETLWANVTAAGAFDVLLPVPTSSEGTSVQDWMANVSAPAGWTVAAEGSAIRIRGTGAGSVSLCALQAAGEGEVAEAYLGATWGNAGARPDPLPVDVEAGPLTLSIHYQAGSNFCGTSAEYEGTNLAAGRRNLSGESVAMCT